MAKRTRNKDGKFIKKTDKAVAAIVAAGAEADAMPPVDEAIRPNLPKPVNGSGEDVSAIRAAATKGLRRVEDWNEYEKQQQGLPPMLPEFINERRMKYILIGRENFGSYPLSSAVTPVTRDVSAFNVLPDEAFSDGIYSVGDSVVCTMDYDDYEAYRYHQKARMRARIDGLKTQSERDSERAESGQEVEGKVISGVNPTDDVTKDFDYDAALDRAALNT